MREKPLDSWIIADPDGKVLAAHCTCMAGLGEACTHIAALLFSIDAIVQVRDNKTVTQEKAYWLLPTSVKGVEYKECREIDFSSAKSLKRKLDNRINSTGKMECASTSTARTSSRIPKPTREEADQLFKSLHECGSRSAILSVVPPYSDEFVPKPVTKPFPTVLTELRDEDTFDMNFAELLDHCKGIAAGISVTQEQAATVEKETREQANSKLWFRFRAGRITASKMKLACCTDPTQPAASLIKAVCYPDRFRFTSKATDWGCSHEKLARDMFLEQFRLDHPTAKIEDVGFFINPEVPYIGASPDGLLSCECCGIHVIEVKCPYCKKDTMLDVEEKGFYLKKDQHGSLKLDRDHAYFYQIQTQLGVCKLESAYFVVWTENDMHSEEISFDEQFWVNMCVRAKHIFSSAILPELVGKFNTRLLGVRCGAGVSVDNDGNKAEKRWCYCDQVESGRMLGCDNAECSTQWFHYTCLGISGAPKGKWYCPDCRKLPQFKKGGKKVAKTL